MSQLDSDLEWAYAQELGTVSVQYLTQGAVRGFLDESDEPVQTDAGDIIAPRAAVTVRTGSLSGLERRKPITVDGRSFTILDVQRVRDGKEQVIYLV